MKKTLCAFTALIMIFLLIPFNASAAAESYDAVISAPAVVELGDVISVEVAVRNISVNDGTYSNGIFSTAFTLLFDTAVFEPVEYSAAVPSNWEHFERAVDFADGKWTLFASWNDEPFDGVNKDDVIVFTLKLKVTNMFADGTSVLKINNVQGSNGSMQPFNGKGSQTTVKMSLLIPKDDSGLTLDKENGLITSSENCLDISYFKTLFLCDATKVVVKQYGYGVSGDEYVATGMEVTDYINTYTIIIKGDINCDGEVDSSDATAALKYDAGIIDLDDNQLIAADVNNDEETDSADATMILKYDAGMIDEF